MKGVARDEALWKAVLGILRLQAIQDISSVIPIQHDALLMFNLCDQLPGGDLILETLANMSNLRELDRENDFKAGSGMYSISALDMVSNLGFVFGTSSNNSNESRIAVGEISVGEMTSLERAVKESKNNYKKVVSAQATVDGVKVDGIDTNLAVMKVLVYFLLLPFGQAFTFLLFSILMVMIISQTQGSCILVVICEDTLDCNATNSRQENLQTCASV